MNKDIYKVDVRDADGKWHQVEQQSYAAKIIYIPSSSLNIDAEIPWEFDEVPRIFNNHWIS